jgi:hypothetical protein
LLFACSYELSWTRDVRIQLDRGQMEWHGIDRINSYIYKYEAGPLSGSEFDIYLVAVRNIYIWPLASWSKGKRERE